MKNSHVILIIIALILLFTSTRSFNALVMGSNNLKAKWEPIEGPLGRRNDLLRDLLNAARGSTMSEVPAIGELDALRAQWASLNTIDEKIKVSIAVDNALSSLLNAVEDYPDLKNKEVFSKVMSELPGVRNRLETEKEPYNKAVLEYNDKVKNLPSSIIANLFGFKLAMEYPSVE